LKTCPTNPAAILIDLDGTLADSLSVMREAYQLFLGDFQVCGTDNEFSSLNGPPLVEVVQRLKVAHALPYDADTLASKYFGIIDQLYRGVSPAHGARQLLSTAKSQGCRISVVTSNSADRTSTWLTRVDLAQFVDFIISGEQVKYGKPDPEPYLLASRKVDCPVDRIIAIEDSIQGASSAIGAGLYTYLLTPVCKEPISHEGAVPALSLEQIATDVWGQIECSIMEVR
jgi:HAD superfamily hydrolase (TIGR01509 family)